VSENYDAIIIASGAGGGTLAYDLAGYPCLVHAKADADVIAVRPLLGRPNVTLLTRAEVTRLETDDSGWTVTGVVVSRDGNREVYRGDIVAVSAGAANSVDMAIPPAGCAHQAGTCRFGTDPATSVLDVDCKAYELDNLYVVDTSFFPSIGAINPALTAIANALRVGDHIKSRVT